MRVLLVDDESLALDRLRAFLSDIDNVEVVGEARDGDAALQQVAALAPDLVILDVQMPHRNGLSAAAAIPTEQAPEIVFITAHEHFAPDAFEVEAVDFILKPVRFERLRQAIERARRRRAMRAASQRADDLASRLEDLTPATTPRDRDFWAPTREGQMRVPLEAILWIEAARDYVLLHTGLRSHMIRTTMAALEGKLDGSDLVRVHRSAFVRLAAVTELRRANRGVSVVLKDGSSVQVGPSYVSRLEIELGA